MTKKTAMVTGASSGIGAVFARKLAQDGYAVTCVARSGDKLQELVKSLGEGHRMLVADLSDTSRLQSVVDDLERTRYSLLVNNAGYNNILGTSYSSPVKSKSLSLKFQQDS